MMWQIFIFVAIIPLRFYVLSTSIEFSVKENSKIGTVIGNLYSSLPHQQNKSKLELINNDYRIDSYFSLVKDSGELLVRSLIDREIICEDRKDDDCIITLLVDAIDVIQIRIKIEDVNDNSPTFQSAQKTITIQENIPFGTLYFLPVAQDKDTAKYGVNNYSISGFRAIDTRNREKYVNKDRFFQIEGTQSPQLQVIGSIDREEITSFVFVFVASDFGQRTGSCTMTVIVTDVNDNSPEWKKDTYKVKIRECQSHGEILEFDATDKDDSNTNNGRVTYKISDRTKNREKISQIFYLNGNKLYLSNNRPSELTSTGILTIFILALDGAGRMKETQVEITVDDCNDQPPTISISKRYAEVTENVREKQSLSIVNVKDSDRGKNGIFDCTLNDTSVLILVKSHIDLNQNNIIYKIKTNREHAFDREIGSTYTVEIKCEDQGDPVMTSSQRFSINILDQNDNAPKFDDRVHIFHLSENNAIGSMVGQVRAVDPDSGLNGHVKYTLLGDSDYFAISIYGEIQSKIRFDREEKDNYEFVLLASDNGNPSLNDTMRVKVFIGDLNDCRPVFNDDYHFKVTESFAELAKNERIGKVEAIDRDNGNNGTVHYRIVNITALTPRGPVSQNIQIQRFLRISLDGVISIYGNLDREIISTIYLTIEAFDNGNPSLTSQTTVTLEVQDLNDNSPTFIFPNKANKYLNISLDLDIGSHVGTITAHDPDHGINGTIHYELIGAVKQQNFPLKFESDGKVIVIADLKRYSKNHRLPDIYSLRASDNSVQVRSTIGTLFVNYIDSSSDQAHPTAARKSTEHASNNSLWKQNNRNKLNNENYHTSAGVSDSMMLLYCLAAILFFVFIIVFSVLLYIYCSKVYTNSERFSKEPYKSNETPINSSHNMKELQQMTRNAQEFQECHSVKNEDATTVCFLNDDGSSYTHLMMLGNNKYTPMRARTASRNSYMHPVDRHPSEILSVSQNFLDSIANGSKFETASPQMSKSSIKKYSLTNTNNSPLANCPENYATLQDKESFSSLSRKHRSYSHSSPDKQYVLDQAEFSLQQQHQNFHSPYVTSSFV